MRGRTTIVRALAVAGVLVVAASCGTGTSVLRAAPPVGVAPAADAPTLPAVTVKDVAGGPDVNLTSLVPSNKLLLVWFWAPSCPYCNQDAASVEQFAKANADVVKVVGLGTQDSFAAAQDFVRRHGITTPEMLWDPTSASWADLGVATQPVAMVFDKSGRMLTGWIGGFDPAQVLALAKQA